MRTRGLCFNIFLFAALCCLAAVLAIVPFDGVSFRHYGGSKIRWDIDWTQENLIAGIMAASVIIICCLIGERQERRLSLSLYFCAALFALAAAFFYPDTAGDFGRDFGRDFGAAKDMERQIALAAALLSGIFALAGYFFQNLIPRANEHALLDLETEYPHLKGFREAFEAEAGPWMNEQEERRREAIRHQRKTYLIMIPPLNIVLLWILSSGGGSQMMMLAIVVTIGGYASIAEKANKPLKKLKSEMKNTLLELLCKKLSLTYYEESKDKLNPVMHRIDPMMFTQLDLVPGYTFCNFIESFSGTHHNVPFDVSSVCMGRKSDGSDSDGIRYTFDGLLIELKFPLPFPIEARVCHESKKMKYYLKRAIQKTFVPDKIRRNLKWGNQERINLAYGKFERAFEVFSTDQVMARMLLTPDILEGLVRLAALASADHNIQAGFTGASMLIAIQTKGFKFNIGAMDLPMRDRGRIRKFVEEVALIHTIIERMELKRKAELMEHRKRANTQ